MPSPRALRATLQHSNALVRGTAARALAPLVEQQDRSVIDALKPLLEDPIRKVRIDAAWYDGVEWNYTITTEAGISVTALQSQIKYPPPEYFLTLTPPITPTATHTPLPPAQILNFNADPNPVAPEHLEDPGTLGCFELTGGLQLQQSFECRDELVHCDFGQVPNATCQCQDLDRGVTPSMNCSFFITCTDGTDPHEVDGQCQCTTEDILFTDFTPGGGPQPTPPVMDR